MAGSSNLKTSETVGGTKGRKNCKPSPKDRCTCSTSKYVLNYTVKLVKTKTHTSQ